MVGESTKCLEIKCYALTSKLQEISFPTLCSIYYNAHVLTVYTTLCYTSTYVLHYARIQDCVFVSVCLSVCTLHEIHFTVSSAYQL